MSHPAYKDNSGVRFSGTGQIFRNRCWQISSPLSCLNHCNTPQRNTGASERLLQVVLLLKSGSAPTVRLVRPVAALQFGEWRCLMQRGRGTFTRKESKGCASPNRTSVSSSCTPLCLAGVEWETLVPQLLTTTNGSGVFVLC